MTATVTVGVEDPRQPEVAAMLRAGEAFARTLYAPEECFLLSVDELATPGTTVLVARDAQGAALGMAALIEQDPGEGELKRLFVDDAARGQGVADAIMDALEQAARERSIRTLRLETGTRSDAALRFYARRGYERIPAFGPYVGSATSVCLARELS
ncbi:MAG: GNAT family N-acetyltransferase [Microcella pacifica]|uniref:GNAT family N-acetyltransferase n=1 Tax=Microcella pacifica TaxID=2591847 RepID=UPI00331520FF